MKILSEIQGKPSIAILRAIQGLVRLKDSEKFVIDMSYFGTVKKDVCCGCAATAAIQRIAQIDLTPENISTSKSRAEALGFDWLELHVFEFAIDEARKGYLRNLFDFCQITNIDVRPDFWRKRWLEIRETYEDHPFESSLAMLSLLYLDLVSLGF